MTPAMHRLILSAAAAATLTMSTAAIAREKSDIITLVNGDHITGEIIELRYGQLTVKTDSLGTVQIEWLDVARIDSPYTFFIETNANDRYSGSVSAAPESGHIAIADRTGTVDLPVTEVAMLNQLEAGFIERLNGSFSFGFDQSKSSEVTNLTFNFDTEYRSERYIASLSGNATSTTTSEFGTQKDFSLSLANQFLRPGDRFWLGLASFENNEQQGIDGRLLVGAGFGRYWIRKPDMEFATYAGVGVIQEWAVGSVDDQQSVEAMLGLQWKVFRFNDPKTTLTSRLQVMPSLTESGRYRGNAYISLSHEIVNDLYIDLSLNGTYDSDPPDITADSIDYSLSTSLGYKF
jgi:putative salt-induced outer membrane protein YdiY